MVTSLLRLDINRVAGSSYILHRLFDVFYLQTKVVESGHNGYVVQTYLIIVDSSGKQVSKEKEDKCNYTKKDAVALKGTKEKKAKTMKENYKTWKQLMKSLKKIMNLFKKKLILYMNLEKKKEEKKKISIKNQT